MSDLRAIEKQTFRAARDDGLLDVMMAAFVAMFALAPLWSSTLGDFWSSAVFGPIWYVAYLIVRYLQGHVVVPRVGTVQPGIPRQDRLRRIGIGLTLVLVIAYGVGIAAARGIGSDWLDLTGLVYPIVLGVVAFVVFSMTAYGLSVWRYYVYGVLVAVAPIVGEGLWQNDLVDHHGFPITFGTVALIMLITGIVRFSTVLRSHPVPIHPQVS